MRGPTGRIVLEVEPAFKRKLHARLAAEGRTLKSWFVEQAERYLTSPEQLALLVEEEETREGDDRDA